MNDVRFGLRMLAKSPGFTLVAIFTLALGIGANTAIFSVVNALLLKPLPFPAPQQVVAVGMTDTRQKAQIGLGSLSYPDFFDFRAQNQTFAAMAAYRDRSFALTGEQPVTSVRGMMATAELFDVLGVKPVIGRTFARADEQPGGGPGGFKIILTDDFWHQHFGGDPSVVGRTIEINRRIRTVIGVLPPRFQYPISSDPTAFYITMAEDAMSLDGSKPVTEERGNHSLDAIARLKSGTTMEQGQADLSTIAARLEKQYPTTNTDFGVRVKPLREELVGDVRTALYVLFAAVVCVLLIANANVANLLLARASVRGKEIALRAAVGASRARIVRQLLTESVILAGLGGFCGLLVAQWGTEALVKAVPENIPRITEIRLDGVVLAFTVLVSLGTGIIFGLVPAWQASKVDLNSSLKLGARTGSGELKSRFRNGLVMGEVALALVLLICAALLIQTFSRLGRVQPGFRSERLLTASIHLSGASYPKNENKIAFYDRLLERIRALPGVESASAITPLPLSGSNMVTDFDTEEHPLPEGQRPGAPVRIIATDYFKTMGIPLRQGRGFDQTERIDSPPVVIVNERFAARFFPGQNVIGKRIKPGFSADDSPEKMREIVGLVGNVKHRALNNEDSPEMYLPRTQIPSSFMSLVIRTNTSDSGSLTSSLREELAAVDSSVPLDSVRIFDEYVARSLARPRFNALLLSIFAASALLLTAIGIYGVLAYSVAQRTNEIGIRMALGAAQSNIFRLVIGQAMTIVGISVVIGVVGAFAATRMLNSLLYGISAWEPLTFSAIAVLISVVAFLATWLPARRASRVDPIVALRTE